MVKRQLTFNFFGQELEKMLGALVTVKTCDDQTVTGELRGYEKNHLHVAIMTDTHKIILRNIKSIARVRKLDNPKGD